MRKKGIQQSNVTKFSPLKMSLTGRTIKSANMSLFSPMFYFFKRLIGF